MPEIVRGHLRKMDNAGANPVVSSIFRGSSKVERPAVNGKAGGSSPPFGAIVKIWAGGRMVEGVGL